MTNSNHLDLPDYHTHHELCRHAEGKTLDYAIAARERGVKEFAATDHCPTDVGFGQEHRMYLDQFSIYRRDVEIARQDVPEVTVLFGVEADYYRGCEKFLAPFLKEQEFDIVLGSIHFRDYWSDNPRKKYVTDKEDHDITWQEYFQLTGELAETGLYDVVTHMDLPKRFGAPADEKTIREHALPSLDKIAAAGMAIEINTSGMTHSMREQYPSLHILTWAAERGIGLVFGSDAHSPARVGDGFDIALRLAKMAGFKEARRYRQRKWTAYAI
jgi:histidinol-phosphatase (PHP family)